MLPSCIQQSHMLTEQCLSKLFSSPLSVLSIHPACFPFLPFSPQTIYHSLSAGGPVNVSVWRGRWGRGRQPPKTLSPHLLRKSYSSPHSLSQMTAFTSDSYINHTQRKHTHASYSKSVSSWSWSVMVYGEWWLST